jgi:hypothetical protein
VLTEVLVVSAASDEAGLARFNAACTAVVNSGRPRADALLALGAALSAVLPADGVAVTLMTSDTARETAYASDDLIGAFEQAQYTVSSGPTLGAFQSGRPVLRPDMTDATITLEWPGLAGHAATASMGSVFCFPLGLGATTVGVVCLYRGTPRPLNDAELALVLTAADITSLALLELQQAADEQPRHDGLPADVLPDMVAPVIHQATGMLMMALDLSAAAAFARLRAYGFSHDLDLQHLAEAIVARRLRLDPDPRPPDP